MPAIRGLDRTHTHVQKFPEIGITCLCGDFGGRVAQTPRRRARVCQPRTPERRECRRRACWDRRRSCETPGQARAALRDGDQRPVVPLAARARARSASARLDAPVHAGVHYYNDEAEVEGFVGAASVRLSRYGPEVDLATTVLDGEIDGFLSAASPTAFRGRRNQGGIAISRPIRVSAYAPFGSFVDARPEVSGGWKPAPQPCRLWVGCSTFVPSGAVK
jgi:hypothetical protein